MAGPGGFEPPKIGWLRREPTSQADVLSCLDDEPLPIPLKCKIPFELFGRPQYLMLESLSAALHWAPSKYTVL